MKKLNQIAVLVLCFYVLFFCACAMRDPDAMTPEQREAEIKSAQETVALGEKIAESGEWLPYPLNLFAVAGGTVLVIVGGRKAAKLTTTAAAKVIVPAVAKIASNLCKEKRNEGNCPPAAGTSPEGASVPENASDLTDFDGNNRDEAQA